MALLEYWNVTTRSKERTNLDRVTLEIPAGRTVGLLGPNGSGKTLLLQLAAGLALPAEGELRIDGELVGPTTKAKVSYLPARSFLPDRWQVKELIRYYEDFYQDFRREKAEDLLDRFEINPKTRVRKLPAGSRDKLRFLLSLSRDASLFLLDEPFRIWDPTTRGQLTGLIQEFCPEDSTVVIATQMIADVEPILDDVILLREGRLVEVGDAREIRQREGMSMESYFREVFR